MKKNNKKGFILAEAIAVSVVIITSLVIVYTQFMTLNTNYKSSFQNNNVNELYLANNIKKFIMDDGLSSLIRILESNLYVDISSCSSEIFEEYMYCKTLFDTANIKTVLFTKEDINELKENIDNTIFSQTMKNYIKKLNNSNGENYRIIIEFEDDKYSTLIIHLNDIYLTLNGDAEIIIDNDEPYIDDGYNIVNNNYDSEVVVENPLENMENPYSIGSYKIKYSLISNGITVDTLYRNIEVKELDQKFNYNGSEQLYVAQKSGYYKLETWGAQGGTANSTYYGGYGGYSVGDIFLEKGKILYINVGGAGSCSTGAGVAGGFNGGGAAKAASSSHIMCAGGGATHISTSSGLLSSLSNSKNSIIIVAGGGGGAGAYGSSGGKDGSGGGYIGKKVTNSCGDCGTQSGGSQTSGGVGRAGTGSFGQGTGSSTSQRCGGGGGYYGGGSDTYEWGGSGGSGYIGNDSLINKAMYCYNCQTSNATNSLTYSVNNVSSDAISKYAKLGNGYAKVTYLGPSL